MKTIRTEPNPSGAYPGIQTRSASRLLEGYALWPDTLDTADFYAYNGFVTLHFGEVDGILTVTGYEPDITAWEAYKAANLPDITGLIAEKEAELTNAAHQAITAGMDVETTQGTEHFSLEETDQINLNVALTAVQGGAAGYPYHADGQLCRLFTPDEIHAIAQAATAHKLYHTTLCNHLLTWARRAETAEEITAITYSGENLPADLAENMAGIFAAAASL